MIGVTHKSFVLRRSPEFDFGESTSLSYRNLGFLKPPASFHFCGINKGLGGGPPVRSSFLAPLKAMDGSRTSSSSSPSSPSSYLNDKVANFPKIHLSGCNSDDNFTINDCKDALKTSTVGNSTNIAWHKCAVEKSDRQELLRQKGCVIWITGLSGSGKSTLACALCRGLHARGKLAYILDGDNVRHGLNRDLSFKAEDRAENIRRIGEVAKLFADAGVICIASLISPYRKDRDACRALLPDGAFIEVFMDVPLQVCEARDPKGLYKLARAGKIKGT